MSFFCIDKSIEIPAIITVFVHNWYSEALVKELQSKNCTFTQKAGFPMHFHCRLTANICSVRKLIGVKDVGDYLGPLHTG